jgi:predicted nucleic acid-binding protein
VKKAVADTSALISIALSGRLNSVVQTIQLIIPNEVLEELEELKRIKDEKGKAAEQTLSYVGQKKISVKNIRAASYQKWVVRKVDYGEAACFALAVQEKILVIMMDDLSAASALESHMIAHHIHIRISASAIVELYKQKKLSGEETRNTLLQMIHHRKWEKTTLEYLIKKQFPK